MTEIAVLGTGRMGTSITRRLLATGHAVAVWNRTTARAAPLQLLGAHVAATPAEAAYGATVVITMLSDAAAVETVLTGTHGVAGVLDPQSTVVEMSTIGPDAVRALDARLPPGTLVDAPVVGGVTAAADGVLRVLAGGPVDRVASVLTDLGTVHRCGPVGSGAALKLVVNAALMTAVAALADALRVAEAVGVPRTTALKALDAGPLGGAVRRATATGAGFGLRHAAKDADLALAAVGDPSAIPTLTATAQLLHTAAVGDPDADLGHLADVPPRTEQT